MSITALTGAADAAGRYYVTFVARACPSYGDIYANAARNDGIESLVDLGANSRYDESRALVTPAHEEIGLQLKCRPLRNWAFTLGRGRGRARRGWWVGLVITGDRSLQNIDRDASLGPLLDNGGNPVDRSAAIPGVVTIRLARQRCLRLSGPADYGCRAICRPTPLWPVHAGRESLRATGSAP